MHGHTRRNHFMLWSYLKTIIIFWVMNTAIDIKERNFLSSVTYFLFAPHFFFFYLGSSFLSPFSLFTSSFGATKFSLAPHYTCYDLVVRACLHRDTCVDVRVVARLLPFFNSQHVYTISTYLSWVNLMSISYTGLIMYCTSIYNEYWNLFNLRLG